MPLPAILYYKRGHFVIIESVVRKQSNYEYNIVDPDFGRAKLSESNLIEKWMTNNLGIVVLVSPSKTFKDIAIPDAEQLNLKDAIEQISKKVFHPHRLKFLAIATINILVVITNWAMPLLLKATIDEGIINKNTNIVFGMLITQFLFFLGYMISNTVSGIISAKISIIVNLQLVSDFFAKIANIPLRFFDVSIRTDLIQRISDLSRIESFVNNNLLSIGLAVLNITVFSFMLLYNNILSFFVFLAFSVMSFLYNIHFIKMRKNLDYATFSIRAERQNSINELINGMPEIKVNNAQQSRIAIWKQIESRLNKLKLKSLHLNFYISNGSSILGRLRDITLTATCAVFVINNQMSMGTMMMISFLLGQLTGPVGQLIGFIRSLQDAKLSFLRINEIYERPNEVEPNAITLSENKIETGIFFNNVCFKYPGAINEYVICNVNLHIPVGKVTAIVGRSGSGKTTLMKLLLGFYSPQEGTICVDNLDFKTININSWRDKCGTVMQNGKIFSGTVAENIAFATENDRIETGKLKLAAKIACIDERIRLLPMGFYTRIGETGIELSGGEQQRILIARAIYRNPQFFIMDEATSSLDANTEKNILTNLMDFYIGKTVVVIAHRLSTVKRADNIVFMESGRIIEQGTHEELLNKKGKYYQLVSNQLEE